MTLEIKNGDCLKYMADLPDKSVDLFICDLPYGETNCKWDSVIDLEEFWKQLKVMRKCLKWIWYGRNETRPVDYNQDIDL